MENVSIDLRIRTTLIFLLRKLKIKLKVVLSLDSSFEQEGFKVLMAKLKQVLQEKRNIMNNKI